jgi:hypothetical protein
MLHPKIGQRFKMKESFHHVGAKVGDEGWVTKVYKTPNGTWLFDWRAGEGAAQGWVASGPNHPGHFPVSNTFDWIYGDGPEGKVHDWHSAANKTRDQFFREIFGVEGE